MRLASSGRLGEEGPVHKTGSMMALNPANAEFLERLEQAVPGVLAPIEPRYLEEPRGTFRGQASALARPRSVEDVSKILAACNEAGVGVIPYGGGTGLVGGQVYEQAGCLILSLERMNAIREMSVDDQTLVAEAGVVLNDIQTHADGEDLLFPLSLASEGSCRIGGNLATNAGGVNVLRWGNTRDLCLGVEAVLADGTIIRGLKSLRKDNTGYDLRHLLIGSEGTLGVITAARLRLFPKPVDIVTGLLDVNSPADALLLLRRLQVVFGETISAFELIDATGVAFLRETMPDVVLPPVGAGKWKVLVELGGGIGSDLASRFEEALGDVMEEGLVQDGHLAQSEAQRQTIWNMRETIPEANRLIGAIASHDISIPIGRVPEFIGQASEAIAELNPNLRVNCFGHLGDGNLHYNIYPPKGRKKSEFGNLRGEVSGIIHDLAHDYEGSFSAEHGVGRLKVSDLQKYGDPGKLAALRAIKGAFDPVGIMNPGVML